MYLCVNTAKGTATANNVGKALLEAEEPHKLKIALR